MKISNGIINLALRKFAETASIFVAISPNNIIGTKIHHLHDIKFSR